MIVSILNLTTAAPLYRNQLILQSEIKGLDDISISDIVKKLISDILSIMCTCPCLIWHFCQEEQTERVKQVQEGNTLRPPDMLLTENATLRGVGFLHFTVRRECTWRLHCSVVQNRTLRLCMCMWQPTIPSSCWTSQQRVWPRLRANVCFSLQRGILVWGQMHHELSQHLFFVCTAWLCLFLVYFFEMCSVWWHWEKHF